ncbi:MULTISPECIES: LPS export ABC transporter ATP-binding protein [Dethiosulfovibrio]|jgi:lipopolysaccharide export system ATP-binding protein|uniref:LPS export ABC transporter ATP-binding protein n=2 Tax=Dethiosulfovibrio TaxID=47054 RepID=A0ABS9EML7_9BACT|nr:MULTISPECIES: LPS export ABC transporter ATP-binding protein [Dethiosulfovibrio]MCF4112958.1 LPS export ABC transporter ATP-binding protein [Dethiosulfovibrio russensis]MCF4141422.1 LPS export ABC transporter ATP-binding protein [Dethiosulfovibrio marinus]MCF4144378.1 LPS export ABC transporter ATP-binding protein [Dethiosulfovibrio acidaminovorans]
MTSRNGVTLSAEGLTKSYRKRTVVSGVDLKIPMGKITGLLGPNGAGKTTSFYMIVGLIRPDRGRVLLGDREITGLPVYRRARIGIGYLPQESSVFRSLTVRENLDLVLEERHIAKAERREIADRLIEDLGLQRLVDVSGYALSGGERRRLEIARCLAIMPDFIFLDEPFSGIDPIAVYDIQQIILGLREKGYGIMITDHNVRDTLAITDKTYLIHRGEIVIEGNPDEVARSEVARKFYLGERFTW